MLFAALEDTPVAMLLGSRQCGKTTLVRHIAPDRALVSLDDGRLHKAALDDPDRFVEGLPPFVTIDEVLRRLPAWHGNAAKRLIKAPKIHVSDSGLGAALADLTGDAWLDKREELGHLLESFVVQQIVAQAAWTDPDLRF